MKRIGTEKKTIALLMTYKEAEIIIGSLTIARNSFSSESRSRVAIALRTLLEESEAVS